MFKRGATPAPWQPDPHFRCAHALGICHPRPKVDLLPPPPPSVRSSDEDEVNDLVETALRAHLLQLRHDLAEHDGDRADCAPCHDALSC